MKNAPEVNLDTYLILTHVAFVLATHLRLTSFAVVHFNRSESPGALFGIYNFVTFSFKDQGITPQMKCDTKETISKSQGTAFRISLKARLLLFQVKYIQIWVVNSDWVLHLNSGPCPVVLCAICCKRLLHALVIE